MDNIEKFSEEKGYGAKDILNFKNAISLSKRFLEKDIRVDGTSCFNRNIQIAYYLINSKMRPEIIVAGLLYGIEDKVSREDLVKEFGSEVATLVFEQNILKKVRSKSGSVPADLMRQIFFNSLDDVGAVFVKLAAKLVNLESMNDFDEKEKKRIAKDALEFYAPLASRLGAEVFKRKIEDDALKIIKPRKYFEIKKFLKDSEEEGQKIIEKIISDFKKLLGDNCIKIKGRQKHIYSIYKKTIELKKPLKLQKDHFAIRVITKTKKDCYDCLGLVHENFEVVAGTLKDYISSPKENGYQSIHTVVRLNGGRLLEVQIRTVEMDENAEEGIAAHWSYKKIKGDIGFEKKSAWMKELVELKKDSSNEEFLKTLKLDLFKDKIYCYTPKGDVFDLPVGSTVLDFAYRIHGKIGDMATGARINGGFVPLKHKLSHRDVVEIVTSKFQHPRRDWLKFVVTSKAKIYIKKGVKKFEGVKVVKSYPKTDRNKIVFDDLGYNEDFPNHKYDLAGCCNPLPREEIIGVMKSFKRILVHKKDCDRIMEASKSQIPVFWKETFSRPIKINIRVIDRSGVLSDILNTVASGGFTVKEANIKLIDSNHAECFLIVIPKEISEVERLIKRIGKIRGVLKIIPE